MIFCRTLGPVELSVDGRQAPPELLWRKHLALLVYLARSPKRARTREHLVGLLWGERPEPAARHSLNEALRVVRRYAGDDAVETEGGQVRLSPQAVQLDVERFEAQVERRDWRGAAHWIAGEFLEGFGVPGAREFEDWLSAERLLWRRRCVDALVSWAEELLGGGRTREATEAAQRALVLDPLADVAARLAMRSLALAGDRAGALGLYESFAVRLDDELGIEPEEETKTLAERVRRERAWRLPKAAPAVAAGGAESKRAPLVGRESELAQLLGAWASCRRDRCASVAVLQGDSGIGKSRLAEEVTARARLDGALVAAARAVEADLAVPWSGVLALARRGLREMPGLDRAAPGALAAFAAQIPDWEARSGERIRGVEPLPLGRALGEVLRAVTDERPLLLWVDDAQWLDRDSLLALTAAVRDLARAPFFLLLAQASVPRREELDELRARLGREIPGVALTLSTLSAGPLRELARWALPGYSDVELDRVTRRIATDSAGIPLLAVELLHAVALGLDLHKEHGAWPAPFRTLDQTLPGDLPDSVVAAIRVGFRRLSPAAQAVCSAAAVLGDRVAPEILERATRLPAHDVASALDELEWHRWLAAEPRGYSFVARIVRDVVARDMLTPGQRQRILEAVKSSG